MAEPTLEEKIKARRDEISAHRAALASSKPPSLEERVAFIERLLRLRE